jgi:Coenzyme PQQ synthesis protein D (PqqD)
MNLNQSIALSPQVISQEVSGETVILDLESECYFGLDAVGTRIWQLIRDGRDLRTIYATLLEEYEVEEPQLQADLEALLTDACERGLITLQEGS